MTRRIKLSRTHKYALYGVLACLWLSGLIWLVLHYGWDDHRSIEVGSLEIHGAAAMMFLVVLGSLWTHVRRGWMSGDNRFSGLELVAISLLLTVTGWMLYYIGNESLRSCVSWIHSGIGLVLPVLLYLHIRARRENAL